MKTMTIEVPREGASVQLSFRGAASSSQVVIVAADDVEIRYGNPEPEASAVAPSLKSNGKAMEKPGVDLDAIYASLVQLRSKRRAAAVNIIKTMFQFTHPITTETANGILEELRRRGYLSIMPTGAIEFGTEHEGA